MILRILSVSLLLNFPLFLLAQGHTTVSAAAPRLIVGLVVENMHPDYVERYWDKFGNDGFKRLYSNGFVCANHHIGNLVQRPSVGMATLFTGTTPSHHCIVSDSWIDRLKNKETDCIFDNAYSSI